MEPKIYTKTDGSKVEVSTLNNFELVNGLVKNVGLCSALEGEANLTTQANVKVCKDEVFKRLMPLPKEEVNDLIECLNHMDELADIGAEDGEEKSDLQKSYNHLFNFLKEL